MAEPRIDLDGLPARPAGNLDSIVGVDKATRQAAQFPVTALPMPQGVVAAIQQQNASIEAIRGSQGSGLPSYALRADLPAPGTLPRPAGGGDPLVTVTNDPTAENNGAWRDTGSEWVQSADRVTGLEGRVTALTVSADAMRELSSPNLFTMPELLFEDLSRMASQVGFSTSEVNDSPVGVVSADAGVDQFFPAWRIPVSELGGASSFSASLEAISVTPASGGTGQAQLVIRQRNSVLSEINAARATAVIAGAGGLSSPGTFGVSGVAVDPSTAFIDFTVRLSAVGSSSGRSIAFRNMMLAKGGQLGFRAPPLMPATVSEVMEAERQDVFVSPVALAPAMDAAISSALYAIGLTPEILTLLIESSAFPLPAGLEWDSVRFPVFVLGRASAGWSIFNEDDLARSLINPAVWTNPPIYVDYDAGSDSNSGASWAQSVKNIGTARTKGEATGQPFRIILRENQVWPRAGGFNVSINPVTVPHAVIVENGGVSTVSTHDNLTWTPDGTYPNLYVASRSAVDRVFDPSNQDADGVFAEYSKFATPAELSGSAPVDGWAQAGSSIYVRRAGGDSVSNANCRAYLQQPNLDVASGSATVYLEGVRLEGGSTAAIHFQSTASVNVITRRCVFGYSGLLAGVERDAYRLRNFDGLALSIGDSCVAALKDGFNLHVDAGSSTLPGVFVNPKTRKIGTPNGNSKNAFTLHETSRAIVINPDFAPTINGSTLANVGDSKCLVLGGSIRADSGSGPGNAAVEAVDNAEIWLVGVEVIGDIVVGMNATVYVRDIQHTGTVVTTGGGQLVPF